MIFSHSKYPRQYLSTLEIGNIFTHHDDVLQTLQEEKILRTSSYCKVMNSE